MSELRHKIKEHDSYNSKDDNDEEAFPFRP